MSEDTVICVQNITKTYRLYKSQADRVRETFHPFRKKYHHPFNSLNNVSFGVEKGETLGIIGRNGSGKSTLLQIVCGILRPTSGTVEVKGKIASLLELGAGFNPEFTGRENVYLNGSILGFCREEMDARFEDIAVFADIGEFIDQPVKTYSSGMYVRLAFAVQACIDPEVLIVDEVLSVGDIFFQQKCHARMEDLVSHDTSVIFVSHDMSAIEKYSSKVLLLNQGQCYFLGQTNEAVQRYYDLMENRPQESQIKALSQTNHSEANTGTTESEFEQIADWPPESAFLNLDMSQEKIVGRESIAKCKRVALCNQERQPCSIFRIGEVAYFYYEFEFLQDIGVPCGGVELINSKNITIHSKAAFHYLIDAPPSVESGARIRFRQTMELMIAPGEYTFIINLATMSAGDYARAAEMNHVQFYSKIEPILRIGQAGKFMVCERTEGIRIPFYGYADLKGSCVCAKV